MASFSDTSDTCGISRNITEDKRAEEAMRCQNEYLVALQETMLDVVSQLDLDRLLENIIRRAGQLMGTSTGVLALLEPGDDHLTPKIALGVLAEESLKHKNKMGEGMAGEVWQTGQPMLVEDYDAWPGRIKSHQKSLIHSIIQVPLMSKSGFVGVLGLAHDKGSSRTFGPEALQQLSQFARFATIAIENARLYSTAQHELTKRKQAEKVLRQSREEFKDLFDNAPVGFHEIDTEGRLVRINNTELKMLGYSAGEVLGQFVWKISAEEETSRRAALAKLSGGMPPPVEGFVRKFRRKDGSILPVQINDQILKGEDGGIIGIRATIQDITGRKQADLRIIDALNFNQTILRASPVGIIVFKASGQCVSANETIIQIIGGAREEVLKQNFRQLESWKGSGMLAAAEAALATQKERNLETQCVTTFGRQGWFSCRFAPFNYEGESHLLLIVNDITERKRAEQALQESQALYHSLVGQMPAGIFRKDRAGRYVFVNPWFCRLKGMAPEQFLGKTAVELGLKDATLAASGDSHHSQIMQTGRQIEVEEHGVDANGKEQHLHVVKSPIFGSDGKVVGTQGILFDITERKRVEQALQESQALYQSLVSQMPAGIFRKDCAGRYVFVNPWFCRLRGLTESQVIGRTPDELVSVEETAQSRKHPEMLQLLRDGSKHHEEILRTGRPIQVEEVYPTTDGGKRYLHVVKSAVFGADGKIVGTQGIQLDVTAHQEAEEDLRRVNAFLDSVIENIPNMLFLKDAKTLKFVRFNRAGTDLMGCSKNELLGKTDYDFFADKKLADWFTEKDRQVLRGKEVVDIPEETVQTRDRGERILHTRKVPVLNANGEPEYLLGISEDITERKQAAEALERERKLMRMVIDNIPGPIYLKDLENRFLLANAAAARIMGVLSPADLLDKTDAQFYPPALAANFRADEEWVLSGKPIINKDEPVRMPDGSQRYVLTTKLPFLDLNGKVIGLIGIGHDITERKRAERQLAEAFNFNQRIISDASVGIVVFKASGRCVLANETAARTLNATVPQILEQDFRQIVYWRASGMLQFAEEALAANEHRQCDANFISTFGREVSLVCHFSPFVQNGEPHLLLVFNDVTEKKKLEAQFLRAQRMESIGTLAGGIAHDLNNVLAPLLISIHLLKDKITDDEGRKILAMLEANVNRGSDLVKQVLAFGRGIQGERVLVQIRHIAREVKQIIEETFPKSVRLQTDIALDLWKVTGDATQIQQVLLNLCLNARDAMPGGGKLSLHMGNNTLDKHFAEANLESKPGRYVVIRVTDTGEGMTGEIRERIFEPFFTTKKHGKGTGLGLSTALAIVKSHGGFITCYSEPGKGSTFKVYFPAGDAPDHDTALLEKPNLPCGHNELVLVVDDEEPIRQIAKQILERFGYRVLIAANGVEAVKIYTPHQNEIAVVITDMAMPVMDGLATIAALQAINPKVKVIGSSGFDAGNAAAGTIRNFMHKPYTAEIMLNTLHEVLHEDLVK